MELTRENVSVALDVREVESKALSLPDKAKSIKVQTNEDYILAGNFLLQIKAIRKEIDSTFDPIIEKAHSAHKEAIAQKKKVEAPLIEAEGMVKKEIAAFNHAMEEERRQQEEEMRRIARLEAEERQMREALELEQAGAHEEAEAVIQEEVKPVPVVVPKTTPKVEGVSFREDWGFEITNENLLPRAYLEPNLKAIGSTVRGLKGKTNIPGVRVFPKSVVAARG